MLLCRAAELNVCLFGIVYAGSILGPDGGSSGGLDTDDPRVCVPSTSLWSV